MDLADPAPDPDPQHWFQSRPICLSKWGTVPGRHWIQAYAKRDDQPPSCGVRQRTDQTGLQQKYTDKHTDTGKAVKLEEVKSLELEKDVQMKQYAPSSYHYVVT